jgi:hypothetical protein
MSRDSAYYDDQSKGGGMGGKIFKAMEGYGGPAALAGSAAAGYADYRRSKQKEQDKREADAEIKRESRGVEKPANFDAIQQAKQDAKDRADAMKQEKAYNASLSSEGMKKGGKVKKMSSGGYTRAADGIAQRGKTRGKMC